MGFLFDGKKKEKEFASLFNKVEYSTSTEDIQEHWDIEIKHKIDVKSLKRISRDDEFTNEHYHFIELKNVNGKLGWLYSEKTDYFAFETNEYWVITSKEALQGLIKDKVNKVHVSTTDCALYCLYSREGRKDIMTLVKTIDLILIASEVIKKEQGKIIHEAGDSIYPEKKLKKIMNKIFGNK